MTIGAQTRRDRSIGPDISFSRGLSSWVSAVRSYSAPTPRRRSGSGRSPSEPPHAAVLDRDLFPRDMPQAPNNAAFGPRRQIARLQRRSA